MTNAKVQFGMTIDSFRNLAETIEYLSRCPEWSPGENLDHSRLSRQARRAATYLACYRDDPQITMSEQQDAVGLMARLLKFEA